MRVYAVNPLPSSPIPHPATNAVFGSTPAARRAGTSADSAAVAASNANAAAYVSGSRALTPTTRHLSDPVIRAIAERNGVIGVVLYNGFLEPARTRDGPIPVSVDVNVRRNVEHLASIGGWRFVGI